MKQKTKKLMGIVLGLALALGLMLGMSVTAAMAPMEKKAAKAVMAASA